MAVAIIQLLPIITPTITLGITGVDISIDQQHIHINHTRRINQVVDTSEVINQLVEDQVGRGRELAGQEQLVVQEQILAADANNDRKIKK